MFFVMRQRIESLYFGAFSVFGTSKQQFFDVGITVAFSLTVSGVMSV